MQSKYTLKRINYDMFSKKKSVPITSLQRYIFDDKYEKQCKMKLKTSQRICGVVDSISNL